MPALVAWLLATPVGVVNCTGAESGVPSQKKKSRRRFREGELKLLLCTESASEGLNLQTCGVLFNYDMPWNPDAS